MKILRVRNVDNVSVLRDNIILFVTHEESKNRIKNFEK